MDMEKVRHETIRWTILQALDFARPVGAHEPLILSAVQSVPMDCTGRDLRRELAYLRDRGLVTVTEHEGQPWHAMLTRDGVDVVEYTVDCDPGIARPKKYWTA